MMLKSNSCHKLEMAARNKREAARSKKRLDRQAKSEAVQRAAAREAKEAAKRKNILAAACKADVLSFELSSTNDEDARCQILMPSPS